MSEKKKFWILLTLLALSVVLLVYLNHSSQQLLLSH
jgi:hypothetical protein